MKIETIIADARQVQLTLTTETQVEEQLREHITDIYLGDEHGAQRFTAAVNPAPAPARSMAEDRLNGILKIAEEHGYLPKQLSLEAWLAIRLGDKSVERMAVILKIAEENGYRADSMSLEDWLKGTATVRIAEAARAHGWDSSIRLSKFIKNSLIQARVLRDEYLSATSLFDAVLECCKEFGYNENAEPLDTSWLPTQLRKLRDFEEFHQVPKGEHTTIPCFGKSPDAYNICQACPCRQGCLAKKAEEQL